MCVYTGYATGILFKIQILIPTWLKNFYVFKCVGNTIFVIDVVFTIEKNSHVQRLLSDLYFVVIFSFATNGKISDQV